MSTTLTRRAPTQDLSASVRRCRRKFLRFFPEGFADETYLEWERNYKWNAHLQWEELLNRRVFRELLAENQSGEIALRAVRIESRTNLLFSFEKMALRDAVKSSAGAQAFAQGLHDFLHGRAGTLQEKFERWIEVIASLPRRQTRVLTWPLVTVFGFIGMPDEHIFLKPKVTRAAAKKYRFDFEYQSRP